MDSEEGFVEKGLRVLRRRKWLILQATIAVPIIALVFSVLQSKEYTAAATLLFRQPPSALNESSQVVDPTREAATNGELVSLPVIAEKAAEEMDNGVGPGEVFASVTVAASLNGDTAAIEATTESPELSAEMANAYGEAYISFRRQADRAQVQEAIDLAESSLDELNPAGQEGSEGAALREQLDQLKLVQALQTGGAELVQKASPPSSPSSPKTTRNVALGLILGLLLGCGLAFLRERLDRRVRSVEEMEELYRLPILAKIPSSQRLAQRSSASLEAKTPEGEAFRSLRANLRYFNLRSDSRVILVVSPAEGDGKSTVARGLATTMVEMGDSVVLVEGDLRKGGRFHGPDGRPVKGLSNVLAGTPVENTLIKVDVHAATGSENRGLAVLSAGPPPPNPAELLEGKRMQEVLNRLKEDFDTIILDSPAMAAVSDALALIPMSSMILVVGGLNRTTRDELRSVRKQFQLLEENPIGVVVNFAKSDTERYSGYFRSDLADNSAAVS